MEDIARVIPSRDIALRGRVISSFPDSVLTPASRQVPIYSWVGEEEGGKVNHKREITNDHYSNRKAFLPPCQQSHFS